MVQKEAVMGVVGRKAVVRVEWGNERHDMEDGESWR
jgi:hypothetical protein